MPAKRTDAEGLTGDPRRDLLSISTIRTLAIDAVQAANSGHRGTRAVDPDLEHPDW